MRARLRLPWNQAPPRALPPPGCVRDWLAHRAAVHRQHDVRAVFLVMPRARSKISWVLHSSLPNHMLLLAHPVYCTAARSRYRLSMNASPWPLSAMLMWVRAGLKTSEPTAHSPLFSSIHFSCTSAADLIVATILHFP
nr:hypothetical protein CFP56_07797 [Quercus suber]